MTEDRLPLTELLQKAGDGDFLRAVAEAVLQILMEADVAARLDQGHQHRPLPIRQHARHLIHPSASHGIADGTDFRS